MKIKRWICVLLCMLLCAGIMPTTALAAGPIYSVTYELTGMTADGEPVSAEKGTALGITLTTMQGYETPDSIKVKVGENELTNGDEFYIYKMEDWIAVTIPGEYVKGDITVTATANKLNLSDNANLSSITYYDGGLWNYISLSDEQLQEAATTEGTEIAMSHGCLDNQFIILENKTEDSKASAKYDDWARLKDGKCTVIVKVTAEDGITTKDYILHFFIDPTHTWEDGECTICGEKCQHTGGTATCTEKAICDSCKQSYGETDPNNHKKLIHTKAKEPTYTEEGNIEYWKCSGCGKYFSDAAGTQEISYEDTVIPKLQGSSTIYYALHFETNGGEDMNSVVKESGTVLKLSEYVPVRDGYTFTGWYADAELTQPVTEVTLDNTKTIYAGWEEIVTDTRKEQKIFMTNPYQERDLANGSRNTMSKVCTLKLGFAVDDPDLSLTYETSDPEVATVKEGKITYQGVGECVITVKAAATDLCKGAVLEIPVKVGSLGTPTFTPSVTSRTAKKTFVATSSTVRGVDGWEVQYSIREDFWKPRTKDFPDTGAKLYRVTCPTMQSNRTYYIHVRGYQIIDGEKVYSAWSPVKTIKTK